MTALRRAAGLLERRSGEFGSSAIPPPGQAFTAGGGFTNESTPLTIVAGLACISVLADAVSTLPLEQFRKSAKGVERIDPSPLIADPYAEITQQDWVTQQMMSLVLGGNGLGQIIDRDRMGYAVQIKPQPKKVTRLTRDAGGALDYKFNNQPVSTSDVFHMRAISLSGELMGLSPMDYLRRSFNIGVAAEMYAEAWYQNSAIPSGVLQGEAGLSEEDVRVTAQSWNAAHQGFAKHGMPAVLSGLTWQQTQFSATDAMFIDSRKMTVDEMVMLYRVPPHMIGYVDKSTSWGAGIEQQEMGFVRNTLVSWCRRFEAALSALLPPGQFVKFDFSHRLRGDTLQRAQAAALLRQAGTHNVDDLRPWFDLPPLPGGLGQDYLQPLNFVAVGSPAAAVVAEAGKPPATPPPPPE